MEYRPFGGSGLKVPALSFGTATFGGTNEFFQRWGQTDVKEATRLVEICLERGLNFFDTANVYSEGAAESILGKALKGKRNKALVATKGAFQMGPGPNEKGASRWHLIQAVEDSLRRLQTDYLDVYFIHGFDPATPPEETLRTLDALVTSGKVRYLGCSNFAAWQLMKALHLSERWGLEKYVVYQGYYSLIGRDYEQELRPLLQDQGMSLMAWSPLGWGRLTGKIKRGHPLEQGRIQSGGAVGAPPVSDEFLYSVVETLERIGGTIGKTIAQVALNWVLQQEGVCSVIIGARNEAQLLQNLAAADWKLDPEHLAELSALTTPTLLYPHWVGSR